ncbi:MAG: site-2 protease family protein [Terriglobales bacterium]
MRNWSISVGRIFGVEVRVHLTFLLLLVFVWISEAATTRGTTPERAVALVAIIFGSVVLHEFGHALVATRSGLPARSIILLPIGGVTLTEETARNEPHSSREIRIALAGPMVNLLIAVLTAMMVLAFAPQNLLLPPLINSGHLLRTLVWANLFLGVFNLLPAYPLDGGRVLRAIFLRRYDPVRATRSAVSFGQFFSTAFLLAGMAGAIYGREWSYWLMMVGFFLFVGGQLEDRSAVFHAVLESVRMEDIMLTEFATLSPADTLEDAVNRAIHSLQDDFPVIRDSDLVGVISRQHILETLRANGNGYIQSVMNQAFDVAGRNDSLASAFARINSRAANLIPIVEGERLVGIVTLQNLMHSMALLAETRKLPRPETDA